MPTFYNFRENGLDYSFDDIFVPADLFRDGNLFTWGRGDSGQLGTNTATNKSTPVTTFAGGTNWKQVSSGRQTSAAIKSDGTLWIWGYGLNGQLGVNQYINQSTPVTTFAGGTNWKQVSAGPLSCAAIKTDGTLWTWGNGQYGQLGGNTTTGKPTPVTTFAGETNWKQVSFNDKHCAAIKTDGTLWTWGSGGQGRLGTNDTTQRNTPVTTFAGGTNWKQVSSGGYHCAAIKTDGTLWTWGRGNYEQLGTNGGGDKITPVTTFAGGTNWKQVSADGFFHCAAIKTDGTLWTWGRNHFGQLGVNDTTQRNTPVTTFAGGTNWKQVSCGYGHCAAIKTDGTLWTWGQGDSGQLGTNTTTNRLTPVTTSAGGTNWKQVSGGQHIAAITYIDPVL
jgi:alpha-tubulin suppressor-like RCC1 family protein